MTVADETRKREARLTFHAQSYAVCECIYASPVPAFRGMVGGTESWKRSALVCSCGDKNAARLWLNGIEFGDTLVLWLET